MVGIAMGSEGNQSGRVDRAAIYRELHRDYLDQFNATRQIEWLINGALWAGILLAGSQLMGRITLAGRPWWIWFAVPSVAFLLHFLMWMYPIQFSENRSASVAEAYRARVHRELDTDATEAGVGEIPVGATLPEPGDNVFFRTVDALLRRVGLSGMSWAVWESVITALLVLLVMMFLRVMPPTEPSRSTEPANRSMEPTAGAQPPATV
jgi:hypothetical protein